MYKVKNHSKSRVHDFKDTYYDKLTGNFFFSIGDFFFNLRLTSTFSFFFSSYKPTKSAKSLKNLLIFLTIGLSI